ncbi:MAG: NAD(P)H-hydrate dehydratase [Pirellulaceae bacterium]|nr:NAD(P)H-hydrate dehydratase [Pirellulaceae bacterium]
MTYHSLPLPQLPPRELQSHKGTFGRALLIGGATGLTGAIALSGMATLRSGAGLVTLAVPDTCLQTIALYNPCYMTLALHSDIQGRIAETSLQPLDVPLHSATCVACGPGLGQSKELVEFVQNLYQSCTRPLVIDADGLNNLAASETSVKNPAGPRILTPHPKEFSRLVGQPPNTANREAQISIAVELAAEHNLVIVLKGHQTMITDGTKTTINATGNPGMATAGSGDVLTGMITALICQGLSPFEAAQLGVHLHGYAGDLATAKLGETAMIATDLLDFLPYALQKNHATDATPSENSDSSQRKNEKNR